MTPAGSEAEPKLSRAEQRAREKAEWAERSALTDRLGVLWPNYGCFCGTLEDLRRTVADLERRAERTPPSKRASTRTEDASADGDPRTAARLAVARAHQRLQDCGHGVSGSDAREQLTSSRASVDAGGEVDD